MEPDGAWRLLNYIIHRYFTVYYITLETYLLKWCIPGPRVFSLCRIHRDLMRVRWVEQGCKQTCHVSWPLGPSTSENDRTLRDAFQHLLSSGRLLRADISFINRTLLSHRLDCFIMKRVAIAGGSGGELLSRFDLRTIPHSLKAWQRKSFIPLFAVATSKL